MDQNNLYCACGKPATWVRHTQLSGNHPYCTKHAKQENDFCMSGPPSYFFWKELPPNEIAPKHKTTVEGYEDSLQLLSQRVHGMRYDKVEEFYGYSTIELRRQAASDRAGGRFQLAALLEKAAKIAEEQREYFSYIWTLCESHIKKSS
jgi:hypothetical protein